MYLRNLLQAPGSQAPDVEAGTNLMFLLFSGYLVFNMQTGFAMLSAGSVRGRAAKSIILKNLLDIATGGLYWWAIGYAFAFGDRTNANGDATDKFVGTQYFFFSNLPTSGYGLWFFEFTFAAATSTIVIGAIEERMQMVAYFAYNALLLIWTYPVIVHACWSQGGFLSPTRTSGSVLYGVGYFDFAGSGVVHLTGGTAALVGAWMLGPRLGRFVNGKAVELPGHNASLAILGVFLLWFGWYGFNPGSALMIVGSEDIVMQAVVTTTLSACAAAVSAMITASLLKAARTKELHFDLILTGNGALAGLVAITAACAFVEHWSSVIIGLVAGALYVFSSHWVANGLKIDDPLDAISVHGACGLWGVIAVGLFASQPLVQKVYGSSSHYGAFMGSDGHLLACQLAGASFIVAWTAANMGFLFWVLKMFGLLRVPPEEETQGLDVSRHGGHAYPENLESVRGGPYLASMEAQKKIAALETSLNEIRQRLAIGDTAPE